MAVRVCVCSLCGSYFSSKAGRPRCPRCGGWGRVVEEVLGAAAAARRVRELQACSSFQESGVVGPGRCKLRGMGKLKSYVERLGGVVTVEELEREFDEEWLKVALEELEARGLVVRVGGKLVFREV